MQVILVALLIIAGLTLFPYYIAIWVSSREFGDWKISYKDFKRWYKAGPDLWSIFDNSNVRFLGDSSTTRHMCYFGIVDLARYMLFYYARYMLFYYTHPKQKLTKPNKLSPRQEIESVYRRRRKLGGLK